jgi:hypothetical protein
MLNPSNFFPLEEGSYGSDGYFDSSHFLGESSEEASVMFPPSWGIFHVEDGGSSSGSSQNYRPDSILSAIEEGNESEGDATPPQSEDEMESSPFHHRIQGVMMVNLASTADPPQDETLTPPEAAVDPSGKANAEEIIDQYAKVDHLANMDIDNLTADEIKQMQAAMKASLNFLKDQNELVGHKLDRVESELAKVKTLSAEYEKYARHQSFPAARDPAIRRRLNTEDRPCNDPPIPPSGVYKDSDGNYVYATPVDNVKAAIATLANDPSLADHPSVVHAKILAAKAINQQYRATSSQGKLATSAARCRTVYDLSDKDKGKNWRQTNNSSTFRSQTFGGNIDPAENRSHTASSKS